MPDIPGAVSSETPIELLERADELSALGECLEAVQRGSRGQVMLVAGEAGVGKTTLVRRSATSVVDRRYPLGRLRCAGHAASTRAAVRCREGLGGELGGVVESAAMPHEVVVALLASCAGARRLSSFSMTCTGRTRRPLTS